MYLNNASAAMFLSCILNANFVRMFNNLKLR